MIHNLKNQIKFLAYISPYLLVFTLLMVSSMIGNILQFFLYFGILALSMLFMSYIVLPNDDFERLEEGKKAICKTWGWNVFSDANYRPSLATYVILFTFFYVLLPMILNDSWNVLFLIFVGLIAALDLVINYNLNKCYTNKSYFVSFFSGGLIGSLSGFLLRDLDKYTYFGGNSSNNQQCDMVSKKRFVCKVYKNGELLGEL